MATIGPHGVYTLHLSTTGPGAGPLPKGHLPVHTLKLVWRVDMSLISELVEVGSIPDLTVFDGGCLKPWQGDREGRKYGGFRVRHFPWAVPATLHAITQAVL